MESVQKNIGKKLEIIDFDKYNEDEKHNKSSDECSSDAGSDSDSEEESKSRKELDKSTQRLRFSWKEISAHQNFRDDNNMMPFDIDEGSNGEKYCNLEYSPETSPFSIFSLLFPDYFIRYLARHTNLYAEQLQNSGIINQPRSRFTRIKEFNETDIKLYIAVILWMGMHSNKVIQDNWSNDFISETNFGKYISYDKFLLIHRCFHLNDNEKKDSTDPIYKIRPLFIFLLGNWRRYYKFSKRLTIDECMIKFNGRLSFKQYIMNKPVKWGIKAFLICNSYNGYCYNIKLFYGKKTTPISEKISKSENIVLDFVNSGIHDFSGSIIYIDNYYMGPNLLYELSKNNIGCLGTAKKNRILAASKDDLPSKLKKGDSKYFTNIPDKSLLLCIWQDRGTVRLLSNIHQPAIKIVKETKLDQIKYSQKPEMALEYVKYAKGVDLCNQLSTVYRYPHRSRKWWKSVFFHMLQITITNSYIIYREISNSKMTHLDFYKEIIKHLLGEEKEVKNTRNHNPIYIDEEKKSEKRERCNECGKLTMYKCEVCSIGKKIIYLCVPKCFNLRHSE
jgi:hypothetical protein